MMTAMRISRVRLTSGLLWTAHSYRKSPAIANCPVFATNQRMRSLE